MTALAMERALTERGLRCAVEARDGLAVVTVREVRGVAALRDQLLTLAVRHGFTHVAVELVDDADAGATLHCD